MTTELIPMKKELDEDPRFAVCYARGSVFKREGNFLKIEKGSRSVVHRALCMTRFHGRRCGICPNNEVKVTLEVSGGLRQLEP